MVGPARSQDAGAPSQSGASQAWVGAEATANVWSIYSGVTWAPFAPPLGQSQEAGWRIRMTGGYGQYRYKSVIDGERQTVYGATSFGDLLAGYQAGLGPLTLKAFAGVNLDAHLLTPFDPANPVSNRVTGAKAVLEAWLNLGDADWAALDLSWSTAHDSYFSRLRLGHRVIANLSLGVEAGTYGNQASHNGRAGGFLRLEWVGGEVSASGGVSGDIAKPATPYATLVHVSRF